MQTNLYPYYIVILGTLSTVIGLSLLFKEGLVEKLRKGAWKPEQELFSDRKGYFYDKYVRGISYLIISLVLLALCFLKFF
jgi:hypothetical protein